MSFLGIDPDTRQTQALTALQSMHEQLAAIRQELANAQNRQSGSGTAIGLGRQSLGGFRFPITLPTFLDVVAMTGYSTQAAVELIMKTAVVPAASGGVPGTATTTFTTPPGYVAIADSDTTASADAYSDSLYLGVTLNQGQADAMIAAVLAPVTESITIPQTAIGATPIFANLTGTWTNYGAASVRVTVQGVMFLAQQSLYDNVFKPFFREQYLAMLQVIHDVTGGSGS